MQRLVSFGSCLVTFVACSTESTHTTLVIDAGTGASGGGGATGGAGAQSGTGAHGGTGGTSRTGQDAASGSGGVDGAPDADSSAGTGGASGTGGDAGPRRVLLVPKADLGIELASNDVGIQGYWYGFAHAPGPDGEPSTVDITATEDGVCIDAHVHRVEDVDGNQTIDSVDFQTYWGVAVVLQLNNPGPGENVYDATAQGVEGFSFLLDGPSLPQELRVNYTTPLEYCKRFDRPSAGAYVALISEARQSCWLEVPPGVAPNPATLYRLQINVQAFPEWPAKFMDYRFCIRNLRAQLS